MVVRWLPYLTPIVPLMVIPQGVQSQGDLCRNYRTPFMCYLTNERANVSTQVTCYVKHKVWPTAAPLHVNFEQGNRNPQEHLELYLEAPDENLKTDRAKATGEDKGEDLETEEVMLVQNSRGRRGRSRSRSPTPRRRRRSRREPRDRAGRGHWEWEPDRTKTTSSWRTLPPWRQSEEVATWSDWTARTSSGSGINREAKAKAAPSNPTPLTAPVIKSVSIIPTLEQCGPTVRFWSDFCGITDSLNDSANRSVLAEESINSIVATLGNMNQMERAGLYVGLIRFMGILWADIMRAITIMANQDDMESLMQVSTVVRSRASQGSGG